jgi:hypothetical protein
MVMPDDMVVDAGSSDGLTPSQEACKGKPIGVRCSFKDNRGVTQPGKCVIYFGSPIHCTNLN